MADSPPPPALPAFPRLRAGCRFTLHDFQTGPSWVLENPASGKFFRMGLREERLARRLDGTRSLQHIVEASPETGEGEILGRKDVLMFLQSLKFAGLLAEEGDGGGGVRSPGVFNPMFMRIPLGNPDQFFEFLANRLRRLPPFPVALGFGILLLAGTYAILAEWARFTSGLGNVFSTANLTAFFISFLALKLIHECAHGVACRLFGGRVPDAGLYFVFFVPLTYIDATATWNFSSRWVRIFVSVSGILAEWAVASVAALIWAATPTGQLNSLAANVVMVASVTTLLFNANPLMRFDGYFILADLTRQPNLYAYASKAAASCLGRLVLGLSEAQRFPRWIILYGLGCLAWRIALILGICIGAIALLHGIGLILAGLTLMGSFWPVLKRIPKTLTDWRERKVRLSWLRISLLAALIGGIVFVPIEPPPTAPAVIEAADFSPVRVQCPGFVKTLSVQPGAQVRAGDVLMELENPEEQTRFQRLKTEARRAEAMVHSLREAGEHKRMAEYHEQAAALQKQTAETGAYLKTLSLTAPRDGRIYARRLDELAGTFLSTGKEVLTIGSTEEREARVAISQEVFDRIRPVPGQRVRVLVPGRLEVFDGEIRTVESAATRTIRHESLTALAGGPLDVVRGASTPSSGARQGMELVDPHFHVSVALVTEKAGVLVPGERAMTKFLSAPRRTLLAAAIAEIRAFAKRAAERVERR